MSSAATVSAVRKNIMTGGLKIGLLGGSFNPAHDGHRHISVEAIRRLGLDQVWWLVSPQNPLKPTSGMAPFAERMANAKSAARHPKIRPVDFESRHGTRYTAETLKQLKRVYPHHRFVWLMGADNLCQIPAWRNWRQIFQQVPIAVINRPGYTYQALAGQAAQCFSAYRIKNSHGLINASAPAWCFLFTPLTHLSATGIRNARCNKDPNNVP